jgi:hypothetical protein
MRFDLRFVGKTDAGRACIMEVAVHAQSQKELMDRAQQLSTEGPWYYQDTNEDVPATEKITVESVEQLKDKCPNRKK